MLKKWRVHALGNRCWRTQFERLLEVGGEPEVTINGKKGEVLFYEWTSQLNHMSMIGSIVSASVSEGIIKHNESTATQILGSLRENRHKYNKK